MKAADLGAPGRVGSGGFERDSRRRLQRRVCGGGGVGRVSRPRLHRRGRNRGGRLLAERGEAAFGAVTERGHSAGAATGGGGFRRNSCRCLQRRVHAAVLGGSVGEATSAGTAKWACGFCPRQGRRIWEETGQGIWGCNSRGRPLAGQSSSAPRRRNDFGQGRRILSGKAPRARRLRQGTQTTLTFINQTLTMPLSRWSASSLCCNRHRVVDGEALEAAQHMEAGFERAEQTAIPVLLPPALARPSLRRSIW